jgi:HD superfamily phosphohydrolase YqeK
MIDLTKTVNLKQFDTYFEPLLIDVIDFETKEIIHSKISIPKAARYLNIQSRVIHNFLTRKSKRGYYENLTTKKRYIFKTWK